MAPGGASTLSFSPMRPEIQYLGKVEATLRGDIASMTRPALLSESTQPEQDFERAPDSLEASVTP
jgi:hypothetical protein